MKQLNRDLEKLFSNCNYKDETVTILTAVKFKI